MFKKLVAYFLLLNFVNTVCFYEVPDIYYPEESAAFVLETAEDEIDSITEFIAEVCFELEDNFDDGNSNDIPEHLKKASSKHFIADTRLSLLPDFGTPEQKFNAFQVRIPTNAMEVICLPPETCNS